MIISPPFDDQPERIDVQVRLKAENLILIYCLSYNAYTR